MATYQFAKRYQNFFGYDLRSNDLEFPEQRATDVKNIQYTATGTIEKRTGFHPHAEGGGKYGLFVYNRVNNSGVEQPEILGASTTLQKFTDATITVAYSGPDAIADLTIFYDTVSKVYRCQITEGNTVKLDYSLGLGRDVLVPITLANLKTAIDSIVGGNFSATITGSTSVPAAFVKPIPITTLKNGAVSTNAGYWTSLNVSPQTGKTGPFKGSNDNRNAANFENVTSVQLQNCIYLSNGYDPVIKYDGQNVYRAGLPPSSDGTDSGYVITATGVIAGGNVYIWRQQFIQIDHNGNQIEGNTIYSPAYTYAQPSISTATVTVSSIQANSGYNTNCALVNAIATSETVTVQAGHTMKAGDTAYMWDTVTSDYVTRTIVSTTATTLVLNASVGATTSTTNSRNVISNNLRIRILRNRNTGTTPTLYYELVEIPNNSFVATQTYTDTKSDASIVSIFQEPTTDRSPPVSGKYISAYQNIMVTAGNLEKANEVSFSDIENPEYFPLVQNQFTVTNLQGDMITGLHPSNENFLIFQSRAIHSVTGDVPNQSFRVDVITQDIGCAAHATIQDVRGTICFLSLNGPRVMTGNSIPKGLGQAKDSELNSRIDPLFNSYGQESAQVLKTKRAIAINDRRREKYIVFIPAESTYSGDVYANSNSVTIVYDYTRDAWLKWTELNCAGGFVTSEQDQEIIFIERRLYNVTITNYVYRFQNSGTYLDYQDHNQPIACYHKSPWEYLGEAGVLKNFTRIKIYSSEVIDSNFTLSIQTEKDFISNFPISECSINFGGGSGYGSNEYGEIYGDPSVSGLKHKLSNGRCVSLRVILLNEEEQTNIAITGYELEMALPYDPGFKR